MTSSRMRLLLISVFFVGILVAVGWVNATRPRLLILHSYDSDYPWTRDVDKGIERVLSHELFIHVRRFYMKTKKFSDKASLRRVGIISRQVIEQTHPEVILAVDDYAQKLAAKYYVNDPHVQIVFAGVNGSIKQYGYKSAKNVTGILERKPVRAIVEAITSIDKTDAEPKATFLGDGSYTVKQDGGYIRSQDWHPVKYLGLKQVRTFPEWKRQVLSIGKTSNVLLVGGYRKLARSAQDPKFVPPTEVMEWTERNSPIPVVGMNVFNSKDGIMLSIGVSPYEQGEVSATMALELLQHEKNISDIKIETSKQFVVAMRGGDLKKRGISLPNIYEAFARATQHFY